MEAVQTPSVNAGSNVLVAVRVRPLNQNELSAGVKSCIQVFDKRIVAIKKNGDAGQYLKSQQLCINEYEYDVVFDEKSPQQEIYEKTAKAFIPKLINGQNVTVFAYGATGAGKTHTMLGDTRIEEANSAKNRGLGAESHNGIIPNAVKDLFRLIAAKISRNMSASSQAMQTEQYSVYLTFLEVYNEQVYDLLEPSGKVLAVREDQEKGIVVVAGVTEQPVNTYQQVIDLIVQGNKQRKTESTMANALSSRSHAVLQLLIKKTTKLENGKEVLMESKLSLIDLAGSERASATNNRGLRLQEGAKINQSLLALANCINALAENTATAALTSSLSSSTASNLTTATKMKNVKFRDSKLTHLLKSSLEGNCHLIMIANINPSDQTYEDSHNTLKYANRAKNIKVNPVAIQKESKDVNWVAREQQLRQENAELRQLLQQYQSKIEELEGFQQYVLKYKRIPGTKEVVVMAANHPIASSQHSVATTMSAVTKHDVYHSQVMTQKESDSAHQTLSCPTVDLHEEPLNVSSQRQSEESRRRRSSTGLEYSLLDASLSSLSTADDMVCDYLSTSQERSLSNSSGGEDLKFSSSSSVSNRGLERINNARNNKKKRSYQEHAETEESDEKMDFNMDLVKEVNDMMSVHSASLTTAKEEVSNKTTAVTEPTPVVAVEEDLVDAHIEKRQKTNETTQRNRRESLQGTNRRKSFIPSFSHRAPVEPETTVARKETPSVESTPVEKQSTLLPQQSSILTENDDIMLTIDFLPKPSEEPSFINPVTNTTATTSTTTDVSNNAVKKRRASHLPVASLSVQTRSMRRQSMANLPSSTPTATSTSTSNNTSKTNNSTAGTPITTITTGLENNENTTVSKRSTPASAGVTKNENEAPPLNPTASPVNPITSSSSELSHQPAKKKRGILTESTKTATTPQSNVIVNLAAKASTEKGIDKKTKVSTASTTTTTTTITNSNKENQENYSIAVNDYNLEKALEKPAASTTRSTDYEDVEIDWLGGSTTLKVPPPPSPTRRQARRKSMANRHHSLARVNAMLNLVAENINVLGFAVAESPLTTTTLASQSADAYDDRMSMSTANTAAIRRTTRSMR